MQTERSLSNGLSSNLSSELLEQFEYALPMIKADVAQIRIETFRDCRGEINLRNAGGSVLEGSAASNLPAITFTPESFTGNKIELQYRFSSEIYVPGDIIETDIIISSNGGELIIPVHITMTARSFMADDGTALNSLEDFSGFAMNSPAEAARAFVRKDFGDWLAAMPQTHLELYEHFKFDTVKERAIDNFLILHGMKKRAKLFLDSSETEVPIPARGKEPINGQIYLHRDEWGYVEAEVEVKDKAPWLSVITRRLNSASFGRGHAGGGYAAVVDYVIDPALFTEKRARADICIRPVGGAELVHRVNAVMEPALKVRLNKDSFAFADKGQVIIDNNTGGDLVVELTPRHDFIHFQGRRYLISAHAEIPFDVRLTAQRLFSLPERSQMVIASSVLVKTIYNKHIFTRALELGITDFKGFGS
ncbi:MAG: DUF5717 family protein [Clostridiales bacterium]|jgi:hypothetical protein|nr:DUF5717 family protein [Clostridiales bacterium]